MDLEQVVTGEDPDMGAMVSDPGAMLLHPRKRPRVRSKIFTKLGPDYDEYVRRNVASGLQRLVGPRGLARVKGRAAVCGAFAVPKDDSEDRAISAVLDTNDCVDP